MSAFLGPIHYLLYNKILFQDSLCDFIIDKSNSCPDVEKRNEVVNNIENNTIKLRNGNLEDIVDLSNIHGSLQDMIIDVENRLAYIVDQFTKNEILSLNEISEISRLFGEENAISGEVSPEDVYAYITSKVLNGMPCDRVQGIIESNENEIVWADRVDIHAPYWNNLGRDSEDYYAIRRAVIKGLIKNVSIEFEELENSEYKLRRA